ncbi:MAG: DNA polymerase III subunit gamma/tau [Deltaproteobacteria bacterium]|jgi:DNA polymerase III subunit gamma/tau|nr:DNA polymerase III subunit gamma/tau [Deltaproteobacteria bacterium]MBT4525641.1 DNA polymerase III subunit gamma/tau [Deltaproteobacteria bacterium]
MSYLVLARKLRPKTFHDIIGQEHIWKTLISAIKTNRVAHAFLFTGPRGTGKTSCARVLTKALNCLSPVEHEPCNQCENCLEINKGIATDVLEIDAASNRGIEHIRELREGVKFSPAKCTYKIYIIDEVHMLTTESFNALLKTLEEPPSHVKFILATTDHHKVPITVISRCQRYDFTNISSQPMVQYLKKVAASEDLNISESALMLIANHSAGGLRDALTTMDMLIGQSSNQIQDDEVVEILGLNNIKEVDQLLYFMVEKDLSKALGYFHGLTAKGRSLTQLITDLLRAVKDLSLVSSLKSDQIHWHQFLPEQYETYQYLSKQVTPATLQQYFQILLDVENQIKRSSQAKICAEMGIIKLCGVESIAGVAEVLTLLKEHSVLPKKKDLNLIQDVLNTNITLNKRPFNHPETLPVEQISPQNRQIEDHPREPLSPKIVPLQNSNISIENTNLTNTEPQLPTGTAATFNIEKPIPEIMPGPDDLPNSAPSFTEISTVEEPEVQQQTIQPEIQKQKALTRIRNENNESQIVKDQDSENLVSEPSIEKPVAELPEIEQSEIQDEIIKKPVKEPPTVDYELDRVEKSEEIENQLDNATFSNNQVQGQSEKQTTNSNLEIADQWRLFVENVGESGNKSLLSLLRNSVILELSDKKLVIGYQNIQIFSREKKKNIADVAREFFNPDIKVHYKEQDNGIAASIKNQKDAALLEQKKALKEKAAKNPKVLKALEIFPGSEIKKITLLEELNND